MNALTHAAAVDRLIEIGRAAALAPKAAHRQHLTARQLAFLVHLYAHGPSGYAELCVAFGCGKPPLSRLSDGWPAFVRSRRLEPEDAAAKRLARSGGPPLHVLELTEEGRAFVRTLIEAAA